MLAAVAMCIQFRSHMRGAKFTLRTDHKSLVWLHHIKDTEGMMARYALQQFQFSIVHRPGRDHGNADSQSRVPSSRAGNAHDRTVRRSSRFPSVPISLLTLNPPVSSEDADLVPIHSGEDWIALLDDDLSQLSTVASD